MSKEKYYPVSEQELDNITKLSKLSGLYIGLGIGSLFIAFLAVLVILNTKCV